jgi:hypothetical protein
MTQFESDEEFLNAVRGLIYRLCDERQLRPLGLLLPSYLAFKGTTDGWFELRVGLVNLRDYLGSESFVPLDWDILNDLIHADDTALQNPKRPTPPA